VIDQEQNDTDVEWHDSDKDPPNIAVVAKCFEKTVKRHINLL
tara:strand:- start:890 stop:1015 length:126 start_codon:yes stop_codon:yes gene_type:complete